MSWLKTLFGKRGNWYTAASNSKHVRQVVLRLPASAKVSPQVSNLVPPGEQFQFMNSSWAALTLFLDSFKNPIVFVKADGAVDYFRGCPVRVAFAFYRMSGGGLFDVLIHVDCPTVERKAGNPCVFENPHNLSTDDSKELVSALLQGDTLDVCFTAAGANGPCTGYFGLRVPIPEDCRAALTKEWDGLLAYHQSVPASNRSFQGATAQFERENPLEANPIL